MSMNPAEQPNASSLTKLGASMLLAVTALIFLCLPAAAEDIDNCLLCHKYSGLALIDDTGKKHLYYVNEKSYQESVHGKIYCSECHSDIKKFPHTNAKKVNCAVECHLTDPSSGDQYSHAILVEAYEKSVHGKAYRDKTVEFPEDFPDCAYCHSNRKYSPLTSLNGGVQGGDLPDQIIMHCYGCHKNKEWTKHFYSHITHRFIQRRTSKRMVELCSSCHEDEGIVARHKLKSVSTFRDTFHWQSIKYGDDNAPNCITCHAPVGFLPHEIMPKEDERSSINKFNLVRTCTNPFGLQDCHPKATEGFTETVHPAIYKSGFFEPEPEPMGGEKHKRFQLGGESIFKKLLGLQLELKEKGGVQGRAFYEALVLVVIKYCYMIFMIGGLVGFMVVHQILDYFATRREQAQHDLHHRQIRDIWKKDREDPYKPVKERFALRLNIHERFQHHVTWSTFLVLAVTGFMVEFPESWLYVFGEHAERVFYWRGLLHRIAAGVMIANLFYQTWYVSCTRAGRSYITAMLPTLKDLKDFFQNMAYYLKIRKQKPLFDRFNYKEKMEYWTGWIGNIIITLTGFFLWLEYLFPKFVIDLSILLHTMEAILASCAIMVWHFYEVHLKPGKFPMSRIWLNGKIPEHELEEEHPLEYERIKDDDSRWIVDEPKKGKAGFISKLTYDAFGLVFLMFIAVCLGSLWMFLYTPPPNLERGGEDLASDKFSKSIQQPLGADHFHILDETVYTDVENAPMCLKCHGNFCHTKSQLMRAYYNMHTFFLACETCHIRTSKSDGVFYSWFDDNTGQPIQEIKGENGNYGAKIVPTRLDPRGRLERLDKFPKEALAQEYMKKKDTLGTEEKKRMEKELMAHISPNPIACEECHSQSTSLKYTELGYSEARAAALSRIEIVKMIFEYKDFYFPLFINKK